MDPFKQIIRSVCREFKVSRDEIMDGSRGPANVAHARAVAIWLMKAASPEITWTGLGLLFGRDRTSIRDAYSTISDQVMLNHEFANVLRRILDESTSTNAVPS